MGAEIKELNQTQDEIDKLVEKYLQQSLEPAGSCSRLYPRSRGNPKCGSRTILTI
jgi:hypothetical protein